MHRWWALMFLAACSHAGHEPLAENDEDPRTADARCCMGAKNWDAQSNGWRSPHHEDWILGEKGKGQVSFRPAVGLTYRFEACGSEEVEELDLYLYDGDHQKILGDDDQEGREAMLTWTAKERGQYVVMAYVRSLRGDKEGAVWFTRRQYDPD